MVLIPALWRQSIVRHTLGRYRLEPNSNGIHTFQGRNVRIRFIKHQEQIYEKNTRQKHKTAPGGHVNTEIMSFYFLHACICHTKGKGGRQQTSLT